MRRYFRFGSRLAVAALVLAVTGSAVAATAEFAPTFEAGSNTLHRIGVGALRRWLIKGCDIALYAPAGVRADAILDDMPRCLELRYVHAIRADQFAAAAWDTLTRNHTAAALAAVKPGIDKLHALYQDVEVGDRYKLLYVPGQGTSLILNDRLLGAVPGVDFAQVYFSVWLGKDPLDARLKRALLSGAR